MQGVQGSGPRPARIDADLKLVRVGVGVCLMTACQSRTEIYLKKLEIYLIKIWLPLYTRPVSLVNFAAV